MLLALGLGLLAIALAWTGFQQTDDLSYADAAWSWAERGWFLGENHWALRHMIVLPLAALFRLFGRSEAMLVAPMLVYVGLLAALGGLIAARIAGGLAGALAAALIVTLPVVANAASYVTTDVPEAFFVLASAFVFHRALEGRRRVVALLAGALAGMAFITRETTLALIVFYGLLFLANYGRDRWAYVWLGAGFCLVFGMDALFLWAGSGDPLYRFAITRKGVEGDNALTSIRVGDGFFNAMGVIEAPRWAQGPLMLLTSQKIGLLPWLALPAAVLLLRRAGATAEGRLLRYFGLLGLVWFGLLNWVLISLWVLPRYNFVPLAVLAICLGVGLARLFAKGRRWLAVALFAVVIGCNFGLLALGGRDAIHGERSYVQAVREHPGAVLRTDPSTRYAADWLLAIEGLASRAEAGPPLPGGLYFFNPAPRRGLPADWPVQRPDPGWQEVAAYPDPPRATGWLVTRFGLDRMLPAGLVAKLRPQPRRPALYRVPAG
jgi:4-amino-4-deoxy-L-arabinose transferase-like glycosyltransferase